MASCIFRANISECPTFHHTSSPLHFYYGSPQKPVNVLSVNCQPQQCLQLNMHSLFPPFLPTSSSFLPPHFNGLTPDSGFCFCPQRFHCPTNLCKLPYYLFLCFPISPWFLLSYFFTFQSLYYIQSLWLIVCWPSLWSIKQVAQYLTQSKNTISFTEWMSYKVSSTGESSIPHMLSKTADGFLINLILWVTII